MTPEHKALVEQYKALTAANDVLLAKQNDMTGEDLDTVEKNNAKMAELRTSIDGHVERAKRIGHLAGQQAEATKYLRDPSGGITHPEGNFKTQGFTKAGAVEIDPEGNAHELDDPYLIPTKQWQFIQTKEYKAAFRTYLRKAVSDLTYDERKNLEEGLDPQGGYLVPIDVLNRIVQREPAPTMLAGRVTTITTSRDRISMPRVNYTSATDDNGALGSLAMKYSTPFRVTWTGENPSSATAARVTDTNLFGSQSIPVFTAMISGILTNDMVEDVAFPIQSWVSDKFRETIDQLYENMIVNGSGVTQPNGFINNPGNTWTIQSVTGASTGVLSADDLWDVALQMPAQYENNLAWCFNKTDFFRKAKKLKDGNNRYLFGEGYQDSGLSAPRAKELCEYPYFFSTYMPNVATGNYAAAFGDFKAYYLVNRIGFSIQVLREKYAEQNQVALLGRIRFGGDVVEPWRMILYKVK